MGQVQSGRALGIANVVVEGSSGGALIALIGGRTVEAVVGAGSAGVVDQHRVGHRALRDTGALVEDESPRRVTREADRAGGACDAGR